MKHIMLILLSIWIVIGISPVLAQEASTSSELDRLADEALQLTRFGRFEEAKQLLTRYGELFASEGVAEKNFTIDQIRVLTTAQNEALGAVTSVGMGIDDRVKRVTAFRLAADAVTSKYQPMWIEMEPQILQSFQEVKGAALEGDADLYNRELNEFLATYSVIQPSIKISVPVEKVQKLDSKMAFLDKYRSKFSDHDWEEQLDTIEKDLVNLFSNVSKDEIDPSVWWVMIMTGSIIITTLSYVGWKKYRAEKAKKKGRKSND
ncbi:sporulation protein YpjB [Bacillus sp. FJAT-50079]|uniref:sporulation protein YpjB n=1 Tax=Bacillus sp. FJAT-50079 TaxID=2833577 RepID=UPI001BC8F585|nr:sporulation protein YpjB [Bacillus sp. FJAT-50079]MBS4209778.1 sporulation protein YpjB [Bacillus sp. FJAT-50079]